MKPVNFLEESTNPLHETCQSSTLVIKLPPGPYILIRTSLGVFLVQDPGELALIQRGKQHDPEAKEELIKRYMPLIRYIVRRHYASFMDTDDLIQEGIIGFLAAIEEYKPEYEAKFSSFAYLCILRKIYNVIKLTSGNKHKLLNDAISLYSYVNQEETRMVMDLIEGAEVAPEWIVEERFAEEKLEEVLTNHLSLLEYAVVNLIRKGYSSSEIEITLGVEAKVVDNARTRIKVKVKRILEEHGSLLSPEVPKKVRKRKDLYLPFEYEPLCR